MEENEVDGACGKCGRGEKSVDGWIGLTMDLREIGWEGVEWIHLAKDRDCWQAVVNVEMNVWVLASQS
jgi:hypothetical protein